MASFLSIYNEIEHKIKVAVTSLNDIKIENRQLKTQLIEQQEQIEKDRKSVV